MRHYILILLILESFPSFNQAVVLKECPQVSRDQVIRKQLLNGFTYIIVPANPGSKEIRISWIVNAGSDNEQKDQLEYAHLIEHLSFEGTKNFPFDSMRNYFSATGLKFGADYNAATSSDRTIYHYRVPFESVTGLEFCLRVIRDLCNRMQLDSSRTIAQAGAVLSEIRRGGSESEFRTMRKIDEAVFFSRRNAEEDRNGSIASMKSVDVERVKDYYRKWYRPDLMGLVVVGDVHPAEVSSKVDSLFSDLPIAKPFTDVPSIRKRGRRGVVDRSRVLIFEEEALDRYQQQLFFKYESYKFGSGNLNDLMRRMVLEDIVTKLVSLEFSKWKVDDIDKVSSEFRRNVEGLGIDAFVLKKACPPAAFDHEMDYLLGGLNSVVIHGFDKNDFHNVKRDILSSMVFLDRCGPAALAAQLANSIFPNEQIDYSLFPVKKLSQIVDELSLNEVNKFAREMIGEKQACDVVFSGPTRVASYLPGRAALKKKVKNRLEIPFYKHRIEFSSIDSLAAAYSRPCNDVMENRRDKIWDTADFREFILSNGVRVIVNLDSGGLKRRGADHPRVLAISRGGRAGYNGIRKVAAQYAADIVLAEGVGGLGGEHLTYLRDFRGLFVRPIINEFDERVVGGSSVEDVEMMFQLVAQFFQMPRIDSAVFNRWAIRNKSRATGEPLNRQMMLRSIFEKKLIEDDSLSKLLTARLVHDVYRDRFAGANDFTFFVSDYSDYERVKFLAEKYFGCLPLGKTDSVGLINPELLALPLQGRRIVYSGVDEKAMVQLSFRMDSSVKYEMVDYLYLAVAENILKDLIVARLRTKEGGSYSPVVSLGYRRSFDGRVQYSLDVEFDCEIDRYEAMILYAKEECLKLLDGDIGNGVFSPALSKLKQKIVARGRRPIELSELVNMYLLGDRPSDRILMSRKIDEIEIDDIKSTVRRYFRSDYVLESILLPESIY